MSVRCTCSNASYSLVYSVAHKFVLISVPGYSARKDATQNKVDKLLRKMLV